MKDLRISSVAAAALSLFVNSMACASGTNNVKDGPLDQITLHAGTIERDATIHIHLFDTSGVKMGKAKHRDTARLMASTVPHLLAIDIVENLRDDGFSNVILEESTNSNEKLKSGELSLHGRFTEINPGSQATRLWIGLGAGKSKVCINGNLHDSTGKSIGEFADCRSGLGWGSSSAEIENSAQSIGDNIAKMLNLWSSGDYAK